MKHSKKQDKKIVFFRKISEYDKEQKIPILGYFLESIMVLEKKVTKPISPMFLLKI